MSPDGSLNPPPEERLLRLIRGKEPKPSTAPVAPQNPSESVPGETRTEAARVWPVRASGAAAQRIPWVRYAVGGLSLVLAVEVVSIIMQLARPLATVTVPTGRPPSSPAGSSPPVSPAPALPSLAAGAARPLFTAPAATPTSSAGPRPSQSAAGKTLTARLTLMGIVSGNPSQAIIEDSETKKTYFVTPGQMVDGALLEQVLDNHVILDLDGEKIDLTL